MTLDLLCVVADKNIEAALRGLIGRTKALGIRDITAELLVHRHRDPGCFHRPGELLEVFKAEAAHALVVLDFAWEGVPSPTAELLEMQLQENLARQGYSPWAVALVIGPEIESWVWSPSPHVDAALGWRGRSPTLRQALRAQGLWPVGLPKPPDPKAAVEWALYRSHTPRSSSVYGQIARRASTRNCSDRAFVKLKETLRGWFPTESAGP